MPKKEETLADVLQSLIAEYQLNPLSLSKNTHIDYPTLRKILSGKGLIRVPIAIKLGKYFKIHPAYFVLMQYKEIEQKLAKDKTFVKQINSIKPVKAPTAKTAKQPKKTKSKTKTLATKRKTAAKVPGARVAKRKRSR